jgi:hypothetical protein
MDDQLNPVASRNWEIEMAMVELEQEARNNRSVGTKDEDKALVRSRCREENHSTGGKRDDGRRGVLAVCTVLCTCPNRTLLPL